MKKLATHKSRLVWILPAAAALLILAGCAGKYGRMSKSPEATALFLEHRLPADHSFYYTGRDTMPYAIVGIRSGYHLRSRFWTPVDPNTDSFRKMVGRPWGFQDNPPRGAFLIGPSGERVGVWYSAYDFAVFRVSDDKNVTVYSPYRPGGRYSRGTVP